MSPLSGEDTLNSLNDNTDSRGLHATVHINPAIYAELSTPVMDKDQFKYAIKYMTSTVPKDRL